MVERQRLDHESGVVGGVLIGLVILLAGGAVLGKVNLIAVFLPIILAFGFLAGRRAPLMALVALTIAVSLEHYEVALFSNNRVYVRLDEIIALSVACGVAMRLYQRGTSLAVLREIPALIPLGFFLLENILSTALNHHNLTKGLDFLLILLAGAICYGELVILAREIRQPAAVVRAIFSVGAIEALLGLIALAITMLFHLGAIPGVQVEPNTGFLEPYGTSYEGNIYGHYVGAMLVVTCAILLFLWTSNQILGMRRAIVVSGAALFFVALIASLSRGAWLGAFAGIVVVIAMYWFFRRTVPYPASQQGRTPSGQSRFGITRAQAIGGAVALVAVIVVLSVSHLDTTIGNRFANLFQLQQGTGLVRSQNSSQALAEWARSPIIGLGNGSFDKFLDPVNGVKPWILNITISILHDSGLLGLGLAIWFLWALLRSVLDAARRTTAPAAKAILFGTTGAAVVMLVGAQATNTLYLLILWFFLGLMAAAPVLAHHFADAVVGSGPAPATVGMPMTDKDFFDATQKRPAITR